jgi:hypothetical protein
MVMTDPPAAATKAVVASWVVLVPGAAVGAVGTPVKAGDAKGASVECVWLPGAACVAPVPNERREAVPAAASDASASFDSAMAAPVATLAFVTERSEGVRVSVSAVWLLPTAIGSVGVVGAGVILAMPLTVVDASAGAPPPAATAASV